MKIENGFADVNGTSLYYEAAGSGSALVFIHGFSHCTRLWDDQFKLFSRNFRTVRYDVRGFGYSARPGKKEYCHSDDLKALLEYLEIGHAHLLGLSMGGGIAIDFAIMNRRTTLSLTVVDSVLSGFAESREYSQSWERTFSRLGPLYEHNQLQTVMDYWFAHPMLQPALGKRGLRQRLIQIAGGYSGWHYLNRDPVRDLDPPAAMQLEQIRAPTLVVVGQRDLQHYHLVAETLNDRIGKARKVVLTGVGHLPPLECPRRFNDLVFGFVGKVESDRRNGV